MAKTATKSRARIRAAGKSRKKKAPAARAAKSTKVAKSLKVKVAKKSIKAAKPPVSRSTPSRRKTCVNGLDFGHFRQLLVKERERLTEERERIRARAQQAEGTVPADENWEADEDSGDISASMFEKEMNVSLEGELDVLLEAVGMALQRLADKTYGQCDMCAKLIAARRLERIPYATLCVDCQSLVEQI